MKETRPSSNAVLVGRCFVSTPFDYFVIGGALSLVVAPLIVANPWATNQLTAGHLPVLLLLTSSAHFAASTVRLYTKPGTREQLPFVTMLLPLVSLGVLTLAIMSPTTIGPHLQALYLTWSPYHYAAQAYGLAIMYCYRSGCRLGRTDKTVLWCIAMVYRPRVLGQWFDGIRFYAAASSPTRSRRT